MFISSRQGQITPGELYMAIISNTFFSVPNWPTKAKSKLVKGGGGKNIIECFGHMAKMTAMPIYG